MKANFATPSPEQHLNVTSDFQQQLSVSPRAYIPSNSHANPPQNSAAELRVRTKFFHPFSITDNYLPAIKRDFPNLPDDVISDRHQCFFRMREIMANHGLRSNSPFLDNNYINHFFYPALQVKESSPQNYYDIRRDKTFHDLVGADFLEEQLGPLIGSPLPSTVPASSLKAYTNLFFSLDDEMQKEHFTNKHLALSECIEFIERRLSKIANNHSPSSPHDNPPFADVVEKGVIRNAIELHHYWKFFNR